MSTGGSEEHPDSVNQMTVRQRKESFTDKSSSYVYPVDVSVCVLSCKSWQLKVSELKIKFML